MSRSIRLFAFLVVGLLLGASASFAFAASYTSTTQSGFKGGGWNGSGTLSSGTAQTIETVNIGGKHIPVPMVGSIGAAAIEAAIIGVKNSPKMVGIPMALAWLAGQGLQYINDQWVKPNSSPPLDIQVGGQTPSCENMTSGQTKISNNTLYKRQGSHVHGCSASPAFTPYKLVGYCYQPSQACVWDAVYSQNMGSPCPAGYHQSGSQCLGDGYEPVGQSDWEQVYGNTPPAEVMKELCNKLTALGSTSYACPAANITTQPVTTALSEWQTNPTTGVQTRQVAKITPAPTTDNPERVQVDVTTETKTTTTTTNPETGQPETTEQTTEEADKNPDFCVLHPNALACAELGEPEDLDLQTDTRNISINPDGGWGAASGSCPQPKTHVLHNGYTVTMSWEPLCDGAAMFRPVVIGLAWLAAIYALLAIQRKAE